MLPHLFLHLTEVLSGVPDVLPAGGCRELELLEGLVQLGHGAGVEGGGGAGETSAGWRRNVLLSRREE